jgi:hypothetical protein
MKRPTGQYLPGSWLTPSKDALPPRFARNPSFTFVAAGADF